MLGGGVYAKIFYGLEKMLGGGGVMPKYFMDLKKCLGVRQQILCMDFKKNWGGVVMPKYFINLKKCWGGMRPYAKTF